MKIFIDTANVKEIKEAKDMGLLDGVTTNPSLISKEGREARGLLKEICSIVDGPVSAEVISTDPEGILAEARKLSEIAPNIVVKIPISIQGLRSIKQLKEEDIKTNCTLIFSPLQALLAAKAGATYASPFVGRLDDVSHQGMELVEQIMTIYRNYNFETQVIVASIRNPLHVLRAAQIGAHIATIPFSVIQQLTKHPLTDAGIAKFLDDWKNVPKK